jgi:hypothetical protein
MKILIWALIIVGIYLVYRFTIGTVLAKYDSCYQTAATKIVNSDVTISNICTFNKLTYEDMNTCITNVKQENNFAGFIYEGSKTKKVVDSDLELHNEACRSNMIKPPQETFYISTGTK